MRLTLLLALLLFPAILSAQVPDSTTRDSVQVTVQPPVKTYWKSVTRHWYTLKKTDTLTIVKTVTDTVLVTGTRVDTLTITKFDTVTITKTRVDTLTITKVRVDTVFMIGSGPGAAVLPFGPYDINKIALAFDAGHTYADPQGLVALLDNARAKEQRLFLALTGGAHCTYTAPPTNPLGAGCDSNGRQIAGTVFSLPKWKIGTARYNTPTLQAALKKGVEDGTVLGYNMQDEPAHSTWGGVMTKAIVDSMAAYSKSLYPYLPAGVAVTHKWRQWETFRVLDFMISQNWLETTSPKVFADSAVAVAKRNGVALALSVNIYGGPLVLPCEQNGNQCVLTASQLRAWLLAFMDVPTCGVLLWGSRIPTVWDRSDYKAVFAEMKMEANLRTGKSCRRP
jgi:hypothetical protein